MALRLSRSGMNESQLTYLESCLRRLEIPWSWLDGGLHIPRRLSDKESRALNEVLTDFIQRAPESFDEPQSESGELYDADPECEHLIIAQRGGGVRCVKCGGWFCY